MVKITFIIGEGKGKTSLSVGFTFQQYLNAKSILFVQFLKTGKDCGECYYFSSKDDVRWFTFGKDEFYQNENQKKQYTALMSEGVSIIERELEQNKTDILILDEAGIALFFDLLSWERLHKLFKYVKEEIILTGRKFPDNVIKNADVIVKVNKIKHPYDKGIKARRGIDF